MSVNFFKTSREIEKQYDDPGKLLIKLTLHISSIFNQKK